MIPFYYTNSQGKISETDVDYAQKRLSHTTVFLKNGGLFWIENVKILGGSLVFSGVKDRALAEFKSEDLDMTPLQMGYTIVENYSTFLSRNPARSGYKQGLSFSTLSLSHGRRGDLRYYNLEMPALNKYGSFQDAVRLAPTSSYDIPFSRMFAVSNKLELIYRGMAVVGIVNSSKDCVLKPSFAYLQQHLDSVKK